MYNPHPFPLSTYPTSRGVSLVWLLAVYQSFAWLVCRVVVALWDVDKPTTRHASHANDFVNAKSPGGGVLPNMGYIGMCGPKG